MGTQLRKQKENTEHTWKCTCHMNATQLIIMWMTWQWQYFVGNTCNCYTNTVTNWQVSHYNIIDADSIPPFQENYPKCGWLTRCFTQKNLNWHSMWSWENLCSCRFCIYTSLGHWPAGHYINNYRHLAAEVDVYTTAWAHDESVSLEEQVVALYLLVNRQILPSQQEGWEERTGRQQKTFAIHIYCDCTTVMVPEPVQQVNDICCAPLNVGRDTS